MATLPLEACAIAAPCRGFIAKKVLEYGIKAGITAIVAKEIADNISSEDLEHLVTLNMMGNDEITNRYLNELKDKYATTIAIDPNDEKFKAPEGYPIPEEPKPIIISTPIPEQDKDAGKLVTPIVEQDKNQGIYAGPEIDVGDWRNNVLTAKGKELTENANELGYKQRIPPQKAPFNSHGQPVYWNGKNYITPDIDGHNTTDGWKMFDRRGNRIGTYDKDLNRIKD